ncbi:MAG: hypothetical protein NXH75_00160 [Halobacteriovoraceae bacterium]|nr:hypothetical protein [Halobacteriovoraceae bacterium]
MKELLLDLSAEFPGDLLGECLIDEYPTFVAKTLKDLINSHQGLKPIVRISHESYREKVLNLMDFKSEEDIKILNEGQRLATYDEKSPLNEKKVLFRGIDIFQLMAKDFGSEIKGHPVCLWGCLPKIGMSWLNRDSTLNEIFQVDGGGHSKIGKVIVNGPLGEIFYWKEVKSKSLGDFPFTVKSLHFFEEGDDLAFQNTWKEFFTEDTCKHCLPCYYKRQTLRTDNIVFEQLQQFDCHLPRLFQKNQDTLSLGEVL